MQFLLGIDDQNNKRGMPKERATPTNNNFLVVSTGCPAHCCVDSDYAVATNGASIISTNGASIILQMLLDQTADCQDSAFRYPRD